MTPTTETFQYELTMCRAFIARHVVAVSDPDPSREQTHSHEFTVEVRFAGSALGEDGYLVDRAETESLLDDLERRYRERLLNNLPEFDDHNPSIEQFSRVVADRVVRALDDPTPEQLRVTVRKDTTTWASCVRDIPRETTRV